ncbi:hypothetical protein [Nocardia yunnanensis]|uniref:hypothetical protein n=1 Tax=Nocardia yunnanensis TaxID=2382165 RepID=UPI001CA46113|nr:hypothetical protein [Nocardia yunnanensis]
MTRTEVEHYSLWMRETRHFKPATIARRLAVVAGFYRTCVIDGLLEHSPAEYVRRPRVSNESPTLGLSHLQFEALLVASRDSDNPPDFARYDRARTNLDRHPNYIRAAFMASAT